MEAPDRDAWINAMQAEMTSMSSNAVWELVTPTPNVKPIGCKWVYKKKRGPDGTVETYKARLVAKGYTNVKALIMRIPFHQ